MLRRIFHIRPTFLWWNSSTAWQMSRRSHHPLSWCRIQPLQLALIWAKARSGWWLHPERSKVSSWWYASGWASRVWRVASLWGCGPGSFFTTARVVRRQVPLTRFWVPALGSLCRVSRPWCSRAAGHRGWTDNWCHLPPSRRPGCCRWAPSTCVRKLLIFLLLICRCLCRN